MQIFEVGKANEKEEGGCPEKKDQCIGKRMCPVDRQMEQKGARLRFSGK